jgi:hypothetical protein
VQTALAAPQASIRVPVCQVAQPAQWVFMPVLVPSYAMRLALREIMHTKLNVSPALWDNIRVLPALHQAALFV